MPRDITSYPFSEKQLLLLNTKGFHNVDDLKELSASELSQELGIPNEDALDILQVVDQAFQESVHQSAYGLLQEEEDRTPIVTFCAALDNLIGGGIPLGKITEICGTPGAGKTQLGIQLAVDVQIPELFGGIHGECVYIDCEGSFIVDRVVEVSEAALEHLSTVAQDDFDLQDTLKNISLESFLSKIHLYRCHDYVQLVALSHILPKFLSEHSRVKLIVLDSIAFHFRYDFEDMALRSRLLQGLAQRFLQMANDHKLAVVFMNQMTTKVSKMGSSTLVPALGQVWGHVCTTRVLLCSEQGKRFAQLLKSSSHKEGKVMFDIRKDGFRDVNIGCDSPENEVPEEKIAQVVPVDMGPFEEAPENPKKRQKTCSSG